MRQISLSKQSRHLLYPRYYVKCSFSIYMSCIYLTIQDKFCHTMCLKNDITVWILFALIETKFANIFHSCKRWVDFQITSAGSDFQTSCNSTPTFVIMSTPWMCHMVFQKLHYALVEEPCDGSFYVNMTQARFIWDEGTPIEKMPPDNWVIGMPVEHFLNQ